MPLYSLNMMTVEELQTALSDERKSLRDLAPYNGTVPGATAIAAGRNRVEAIETELRSRGIEVSA